MHDMLDDATFDVSEIEYCHDCGLPVGYDPVTGLFYHVDRDAPSCFLVGKYDHPANRPAKEA